MELKPTRSARISGNYRDDAFFAEIREFEAAEKVRKAEFDLKVRNRVIARRKASGLDLPPQVS